MNGRKLEKRRGKNRGREERHTEEERMEGKDKCKMEIKIKE